MTEASLNFFKNISTKIISADKDKLGKYVNEIWTIYKDDEPDDYFEKLLLLGLGSQLAYLTKHYREEKIKKELCKVIEEDGKNYFDENMNHIIKMVESGLESKGNNLSFMDEIDFSQTFLTDFCSDNYPEYKNIILNLRSIKSGYFKENNFTICFALYFNILGMFYDFPDMDAYSLIELINYYILIPKKNRLDRINLEIERSFNLYIQVDFSERRYLYTDLPFIYSKIAEKKEKEPDKGVFKIVSENSAPIIFNIKSGIRSELQTVSKSIEFLLSLDNILNPNEKNEMRLVLFERVFYNRRRLEEENSKKESEIALMLKTPYGFFKIPESTKIHNESALSLFTKAISIFKTIEKEDQLESGKNLFGQDNIYQGTLNLEHGVAICLYMLLKEMSFDDVKQIFSNSKDSDVILNLKNHLLGDTGIIQIQSKESTEENKKTLLEQMLFFMYWEICGYSNQETKGKENPLEEKLHDTQIINDSSLSFDKMLNPFVNFEDDLTKVEMQKMIMTRGISFKKLVEYRVPFWWKNTFISILNWHAYKSHLNSEDNKNFFDQIIDISEIKDTSLIVELLFRFSRIEPEFKENIISMLNHLRETQKALFPVYYDSAIKAYNPEAIENQKKIQAIDSGFWIASLYQSIFPFNTEEAIEKNNKEELLCRYIINCKLFQESDVVLEKDDKERIRQNYRESNKIAMFTRYLYLDRNVYVHEGSNRTIKELLKANKEKDLLLTLADILTYLDTDPERYKNDSTKRGFANLPLSYEKCKNYIKNECKTLASIILKIQGYEVKEITSAAIEEFSNKLPPASRLDYNCDLAKNEFLKERLDRLLNIIFLTYKPDFYSHSIDFLIEYKRHILLYIISVTFKLVQEINKKDEE